MKNHNRMTGYGLSEAGNGKAGNQPIVGKRIKINGNKYRIHPVYNLYAGNRQGEVIHISKSVPMKGNYLDTGYLKVKVRGSGDKKQTTVYVHRFIYECYNGVIPDGMVIDHINDIKDDNRVKNLQLMTPQHNSKKAAKNRDYSNQAANFKNVRRIKATNLETNEVSYYNSLYATQQHLGVNAGTARMCCQGMKYRKSSISKKDGCKYAFEYA